MRALLDQPPAWYVLGPLVGLTVVGVLATVNTRLGVTGGFADFVARASGRTETLGWKAFFVIGVALGGLLFLLLAGAANTEHGLGWLGDAFAGEDAVIAGLLVLAGALIGFGARTGGGCTSGNGLSGSSFGSPSGFAAMATFMAVAIAVSFVLEALV